MLTYANDAGTTRYYLLLYWVRFQHRFRWDGSVFFFLSFFLFLTLFSLSLSFLSFLQIRREGLLGWLSGIIPALILLINPAIQLSVCVP